MYVVIDPAGHPHTFHKHLWNATKVVYEVEVKQNRPDIADMFEILNVSGWNLLYYRIYKLCVIFKYRIWRKLKWTFLNGNR